MASSINVEQLLEWFRDRSNRIYFNEELLEVKKRPVGVGNGVFARRSGNAVPSDQDYDDMNILVRVHKSVVLSAQTCTISNLLLEEGLDKGLCGLILAFIYEKEMDEMSPWKVYLNTFQFSNAKESVKKSKGKVKGKKIVKQERGAFKKQVLNTEDLALEYRKCCEFANKVNNVITVPEVLRGKSLEDFGTILNVVASRAFNIDEYMEWGLIPGADLFNVDPKGEGHVKLDALKGVCPRCGKMDCWHTEHEQIKRDQEDNEDEDKENEEGEKMVPEKLDEITMQYVEKMEAEFQAEKEDDSEDEDEDEDEEDPLDEFFLDADSCCDVMLMKRIVRDREVLISLRG